MAIKLAYEGFGFRIRLQFIYCKALGNKNICVLIKSLTKEKEYIIFSEKISNSEIIG
jgi:hypothetical protein